MSTFRSGFDRNRFTTILSETDLFRSLQPEFVKAIGPIGQALTIDAFDAPTKEKKQLAAMAKELSRLPKKMMEGSEDIKGYQSTFAKFFNILGDIFRFLTKHPIVASHVGPKIIEAMKPLQTFMSTVKEQITYFPISIQQGIKERLDWVDERIAGINSSVSQLSVPTHPVKELEQTEEPVKLETLPNKVAQKLSDAIFPLGNSLLEAALSPLGLEKTQQRELSNIGKELLNIPLDLLSGQSTLEEAINAIAALLENLFNFFIKNPEVVMKVASFVLPVLGPMGVALSGVLQAVSSSPILTNLKNGLQSMCGIDGSVNKLETVLQPGVDALNRPPS